MKKISSLLMLVILPFIANTQTLIDGIFYNIIPKAKLAEVVSGATEYTDEVIIPESVAYDGVGYDVKTIGDNAFSGCTGLTSVTIPTSITTIGVKAFYGCTGLALVTIPNSVSAIKNYTFRGCSGLTSVTIPNSVTEIGGYAFNGCAGLTSVTIPNSVTSIRVGSFWGCKGLTSVTIPNSVTTLEERVLSGCTGLTSFTIPNSVRLIDYYACAGCTDLTSVTIPNSVSEIRNYAFSNCSNLETVYCYAENVPSLGSSSFENSLIEYATLYVPDGSLEEYKNHSEWGKFGKILPLSGGSGGSYEKEKCEAPTISQENGKINISCGTENAVIEYNYSIAASSGGGTFGKDPLNPVVRITVNAWANAEGYDTSDTTTATFEVACAGSGNKGDVNEDGAVDISDVVKVINIMAGGE